MTISDVPPRGTTALFTLLIKIGPWFLFDASVSTNGSGCLFQQSLFCRFPKTLKTVIFILVEIQKVIFAESADFFFSQFEGHSTQCSQLIGKAMFARLRNWEKFKSSGVLTLVRPVLAGTAVNGLFKTSFFSYC